MKVLRILEIGFVLLLVGLVSSTLWIAQELPGSARRFPLVIGIGLLVLLVLQVGVSLRERVEQAQIMDISIGAGVPVDVAKRRGTAFFAWMAALLAALVLFGHIGLLIAIFVYVRWGYHESWVPSVVTTAAVGAVLYVASEFLNLRLIEGVIF